MTSYLTNARARELSVRMALGASPAAILRLMLGRSVFVIAGGVIAGAALAWIASQQVRSLLFELEPTDPVTIFAAVGVVVLATMLAAILPAQRASRVNPAMTLR